MNDLIKSGDENFEILAAAVYEIVADVLDNAANSAKAFGVNSSRIPSETLNDWKSLKKTPYKEIGFSNQLRVERYADQIVEALQIRHVIDAVVEHDPLVPDGDEDMVMVMYTEDGGRTWDYNDDEAFALSTLRKIKMELDMNKTKSVDLLWIDVAVSEFFDMLEENKNEPE